MSTAELASSLKPKKTAELSIIKVLPPLGTAAINGFNGSGESHSLFSGNFSNHARVNGFASPVERTPRTAHFITMDRDGLPQVRKQNSAEIISILSGYHELEISLRKLGKRPTNEKFALFVDDDKDYIFLDDVAFVGYEYAPTDSSRPKEPINAVFSPEAPDENEQLVLEGSLSIPLTRIHHIGYSLPKVE